MQTVKKKKIKTLKKQKRHEIEHTAEIIDETKHTQTCISQEHESIEHKVVSETHEQTIKHVSLDLASEQTESFVFDEQTLPTHTETGPKPIEIQPLFHATQTRAVGIVENETHIRSSPAPSKQVCSVTVNECRPLIISQIDERESVETKQPDKSTATVQLSSTLITSTSAISDQIIPCDNIAALATKFTPVSAVAEQSSIPHTSKTIYEEIASQKENQFSDIYAPNPKQAHQIISEQTPIEVHEIDAGESEKLILDTYEPIALSATCNVTSNIALTTQETLAQNVPAKLQCDATIASEEATPIFIEQMPYQTHEIQIAETENILSVNEVPGQKRAHIEFSSLQAISMEQTETSETETASSTIPIDLMATAKDTFALYKEIQTGYCQIIDTIVPHESLPLKTKSAAVSLEEMGGKLVETVTILQSEQPFDTSKPSLEFEASPSYSTHESVTISEVQIQESDVERPSVPAQSPMRALQTREEHKIAEQSDVQLLDTVGDYQGKEPGQTFNVQINFELQKSMVHDTTFTHDTIQPFETHLHTNQPHYNIDTNVNTPLLISTIDVKEDSGELVLPTVAQAEAKPTKELFKTYEQTDAQTLDTIDEFASSEQTLAHTVQVQFELQMSTIGESVIARDLECTFDTKLTTSEPHYTSEPNVKSSIVISELQIQESDRKLSPEPIISSSAIVSTQELYRAPESGQVQPFETIDDYSQREMHPEHNAHINFELQKSTLSETVMANEMESALETTTQIQNQPQYSIDSRISNPIVVSQTQLIETETALGIEPTQSLHINVTDSSQKLPQIGVAAETIPYDSVELMKTSIDKGVSAKSEPIVFHEIGVEMATPTEQFSQLSAQRLDEQKQATPNVITKSAVHVTMEQSAESLDKFEVFAAQQAQPNIKHNLMPSNSIVVDKTETIEHSTQLDIDAVKTARANVSTTNQSAANIDEMWPMETVDDFKRTAAMAEQSLNQNIVETVAIQASTVITSDTFTEFKEQREQSLQPKFSINEVQGILTEDIVIQENVQPNQFTFTQDTAIGHISHDVEVQRRCEQTEQITVESAHELKPMKPEQIISSTKTLSEALTAAKIMEIVPNLSGSTFDDGKPLQQHSKIVHDNFNVIGQSIQDIPLESENLLNVALKAKEEYPKKSIEGKDSYATSQIELLEKESELIVSEQSHVQNVKATTEQLLMVANTTEDTSLSSIEYEMTDETTKPLKCAVSKVDRLLEGIHIEVTVTHEIPGDVTSNLPQTITANPSIESKKSIQIERVPTFEKEEKFEPKSTEHKKCDQKLDDYLKAATSNITQIIEQTNVQTRQKVQSKLATQSANESNQKITFESVYLETHTDTSEIAKIGEIPTHAINVVEQFSLQKENTFDDKQTDKLLTKPVVGIQQPTELKSAQKRNETNILVHKQKNKKADKITNKKITKKTIETTKSVQIEGR